MYHSKQEHRETVTPFALEFMTVLAEAVYTVFDEGCRDLKAEKAIEGMVEEEILFSRVAGQGQAYWCPYSPVTLYTEWHVNFHLFVTLYYPVGCYMRHLNHY